MTLLRDIQSDAIDSTKSISDLLRKCKLLAARLGSNEFNIWVEQELNGYKRTEDLPDYRILNVQSFGYFSGMLGRAVNNAPIPPSSVPKEFRDYVTKEYLKQPISYFESLINEKSEDGNFQVQWDADFLMSVSSKIVSGMNCVSAWKLVPRNSIYALIDTVRNRILSFAIDIESKAPDAGEVPLNTRPIASDQVSQAFNTIIVQGNVTNLASSGDQVIINVISHDFNSLNQYLKSLGIGETDLDDLKKAISEDADLGGQDKLGSKVGSWIGKMVSKAADGTWKIATSAAGSLLAKALSIYFGLGQ